MESDAELIQKVEAAISPVLIAAGAEIVKLGLRRQGSDLFVEVLADKVNGGITMDECGQLNRRLAELLQAQNTLGTDFSLELSSPGVDWPLTTAKDFRRNIGRGLQVFLAEPVAEKIEHCGKLVQVKEESFVLTVTPSRKDIKAGRTATEIEIPFGRVKKAVQII